MSDAQDRLNRLTPEQRAKLLRQVRNRRKQPSAATELGPQPVSRARPLPLSFAQQRLWILDRREGALPTYNVPMAVRLTGDLNVAALGHALSTVTARHEILRTVFRQRNGVPEQVIQAPQPWPLQVEDGDNATIQQVLEQEARQLFDLERGPLLRIKLWRTGPSEHVLSLVMHHIITDGWSMGILFREVTRAYLAFATGKDPAFAPLPLQYADFAIWQRKQLSGERLERELAFWRHTLKDAPALLELAANKPRPTTPSYRGGEVHFILSAEETARIETWAREQNASLFMALAAGLALTLSRYSGQDDIVLGTTVAQRGSAMLEPLIGFFVNTLALRLDLHGNPTMDQLLQRVRRAALDAFDHQDLPFEQLLDALRVERNPAHAPVFQAMLTLQNAPMERLAQTGLTIEPLAMKTSTAIFDLTVALEQTSRGWTGRFQYNADLFEPPTVQRWTACFRQTLHDMAHEPLTHIAGLTLSAPAEQAWEATAWNATQQPFSDTCCLQTLFERQVKLRPQATALVADREGLTYAQLDARANGWAAELRLRGIGPEHIVGLHFDRSPALIVGILAVLKAGGAFMPLDPAYPVERLSFMLEDAHATLVLTGAPHALPDAWTQHRPERILCMDDHRQEPAGPCAATAANLAYVIYTSGSTGRPKGVMLEHRGACNLVEDQIRVFALAYGDRLLQFSSPSFDAAVSEIFTALCSGAELYLAPRDAMQPGPELIALLQRHGITHVTLPPSALSVMPAEPLPNLRTLVTAGEACPADLVQAWAPGRRMINAYGPTECTVCATTCVCNPDETRAPPIGQPIANLHCLILDRFLRPMPRGVAGELYIGGAGVARGYLGRPGFTAERFIPDPFADQPGRRLYRSGDRARRLPDGRIEFLGRLDHQVKLRGFRIEPGEIEAALRACPGISQAVALVREDRPGVRQLVGYVAPPTGQPVPDTALLRQGLRARLPAYMQPHALIVLDDMPLTPNGKIDRKALPALAEMREARVTTLRTPTEEKLAAIWTAVLGVERIGPDDHFFDLGGDSILSIQVVAQAAAQGMALKTADVFRYPVLADLARAVGESNLAGNAPTPENSEGAIPLTPIQHWFFENPPANPHHFNQAVVLSVPTGLDASMLKQALALLQQRHAMLRARFTRDAETWRQEVLADEGSVPYSVVALPAGDTEAVRQTMLREATAAQTSLHISQGPIWRAVYFTRDNQPGRLLITAHHLVVDGVSWRILIQNLRDTMTSPRHDERPAMAPTASYKRWAEQLQSWAAGDEARRAQSCWQDLPSPDPLPCPAIAEDNSTSPLLISLDRETTARLLRGLPHEYPIEDILVASFLHALRQWTKGQRFLIDLEGHGRDAPIGDLDAATMVGWCTALYPIFFDLTAADQPETLLREVGQRLRTVPHHGISYGVLRYLSPNPATRRAMAALPHAEISFNYLGQTSASSRQGETDWAPVGEPTGPSMDPSMPCRHMLELNAAISDGLLHVQWTFDSRQLDAATVRQLSQDFAAGLKALLQACPARTPEIHPHIPPRDNMELALARHVAELTGDGEVSVTTPLDALGLDQPQRTQLGRRLRRTYALPMPEPTADATIEQLAKQVREKEQRKPWSPVIELGRDATLPPLFCIHPLSGHVLCYFSLARRLAGAFQPIGLEARGVTSDTAPFASVEAEAFFLLEHVRRRQPQGPYHFLGYSYGGFVAYAMAHQLALNHEKTALLAMLDVPMPHMMPDHMRNADSAMILVSMFADLGLSLEQLRACPLEEQLALTLEEARKAKALPPGFDKDQAQRLFNVWYTAHRAGCNYEPPACTGDMLLLRASEQAKRVTEDPYMGWREKIKGRLDLQWTSGRHEDMLNEPHVSELARLILAKTDHFFSNPC